MTYGDKIYELKYILYIFLENIIFTFLYTKTKKNGAGGGWGKGYCIIFSYFFYYMDISPVAGPHFIENLVIHP